MEPSHRYFTIIIILIILLSSHPNGNLAQGDCLKVDNRKTTRRIHINYFIVIVSQENMNKRRSRVVN